MRHKFILSIFVSISMVVILFTSCTKPKKTMSIDELVEKYKRESISTFESDPEPFVRDLIIVQKGYKSEDVKNWNKEETEGFNEKYFKDVILFNNTVRFEGDVYPAAPQDYAFLSFELPLDQANAFDTGIAILDKLLIILGDAETIKINSKEVPETEYRQLIRNPDGIYFISFDWEDIYVTITLLNYVSPDIGFTITAPFVGSNAT